MSINSSAIATFLRSAGETEVVGQLGPENVPYRRVVGLDPEAYAEHRKAQHRQYYANLAADAEKLEARKAQMRAYAAENKERVNRERRERAQAAAAQMVAAGLERRGPGRPPSQLHQAIAAMPPPPPPTNPEAVVQQAVAAVGAGAGLPSQASPGGRQTAAPPACPSGRQTAAPCGKAPKKAVPKALKDSVWSKYVGDDKGQAMCHCCGMRQIKMNSFHCGHVVAEARGGATHLDNLRPVCALCNLSMGTRDMDAFRAECGFRSGATGAAAPAGGGRQE